LRRASASICSEKSDADHLAGGADAAGELDGEVARPRRDVERAVPGPTAARSAARRRQWWCSPAVMTEFIRS
jgi:hypothetical protein